VSPRRTPNGPNRAKPHAGGGTRAQVPIIQYKRNHSNTPPVSTLATADVETRAKLEEEWRRQAPDEDVGELRSRWDVQNANFSNDDLVTDEVEIDLNMLHALMLNGVERQVDGTDIVAIDKCAVKQRGCSSMSNWRNQQVSATPLATTRYSASVLDMRVVYSSSIAAHQ
jgi:hypothetical protein